MQKKYEIGDIVKCYKIIGYEEFDKDFKYKCECVKCGSITLQTNHTLNKNKGRGCKNCWTDSYIHNDLIGKRFGCYTVVGIGTKNHYRNEQGYICRCDCGNEADITLSKITRKNHVCCLKCRPKYLETNNGSYLHGKSKTQIHNVWLGILARCYAEYNTAYKRYGAKGVTVCDEWQGKQGFVNFYNWSMENGYEEEKAENGRNVLTIDRIDNSKGYSPDNCRWVTNFEQANNKSTNRRYEYNGEVHTISQWAIIYNIKYATLRNRLSNGMEFEKAIQKVNYHHGGTL